MLPAELLLVQSIRNDALELAAEAVAYFVSDYIRDNGIEGFLYADFADSPEISTLAAQIQNSIRDEQKTLQNRHRGQNSLYRGGEETGSRGIKETEREERQGTRNTEIGDIDLVWGEEGTSKSDGFGLAKLVKYHPEVLDHLQEILDDMRVVQRSENRAKLENDTHRAVVRLTWDAQKKNSLPVNENSL